MNGLFILALCLFIAQSLWKISLSLLNQSYIKKNGNKVPEEFSGIIDGEHLQKVQRYSAASGNFGVFVKVFNTALMGILIFTPLLSVYSSWIESFGWGQTLSGVFFFAILLLAQEILSIPFSLYHNFVIEKKFGFNKMSFGLWAGDLIKSTLISIVLSGGLLFGGFALFYAAPKLWPLFIWAFFAAFQFLIILLYPNVIQPLFNERKPLEDEELLKKIKALCNQVDLPLKDVYQMDASKRSGHSNAYFYGLGAVKHIVLFDTLLQQMNHEEILAVLAHEMGHYKHKDMLKNLITTLAGSLAALWAGYFLLNRVGLFEAFALESAILPAQILLLGFFASLLGFFSSPLQAILSRRAERKADAFAKKTLGSGDALSSALITLTKENLSNLTPQPLFAWWNYSHPPVLERIRTLVR